VRLFQLRAVEGEKIKVAFPPIPTSSPSSLTKISVSPRPMA